MKKIFIIVFSTCLFYSSAFSQEIKPHFRSINTVGAAFGESAPKTILQSVNGWSHKDWFAGIGIGVDEYEIKSLPLFLDIRMDFGDKKKGFIYGDLGYTFFLKDETQKNNGYLKSSYKGGIYSDIGIGVRTSFIKKVKMVFTIGHSYKTIREFQDYKICPINPPCFENSYKYTYNYGRINLKVGLEF